MELNESTYSPCDLSGCIYNNDGKCGYDSASIKVPSACACNDRDFE